MRRGGCGLTTSFPIGRRNPFFNSAALSYSSLHCYKEPIATQPTQVLVDDGRPASVATSYAPADAQSQQFRRHMGEVSRQSLVFFLGTIFTTAASYVFKVYVARKLGAERLGIYAIGMSVTGFLGLFPVLGLPDAASRFVSVYAVNRRMSHLRGFLRRGDQFSGTRAGRVQGRGPPNRHYQFFRNTHHDGAGSRASHVGRGLVGLRDRAGGRCRVGRR